MIKIEFKALNKVAVFVMEIEPSKTALKTEVDLLDYVAERLRGLMINYTWFKIIT